MTVPLDRELLRLLPKAELHCHLDGSLRPATMLELGHEHGKPMPMPDAESLREFMRVDDARHLEDYLERFAITLSVMQTESALERVAFELAEDAAADGVRYIEVRFAPVLNTREGLTLEQAVEAPLRGLGGDLPRLPGTQVEDLAPRQGHAEGPPRLVADRLHVAR